MHIPSERVRNEMCAENASLWIVPANGGEEIAVLIKAPTSTIKALIAGCPLHLLFARKGIYLCSGVRILDMPDAPVLISGSQRENEEHLALEHLLKVKKSPVFLFNELDVCLAWTNLSLTDDDAMQISMAIESLTTLYSGSFTPECSNALDCFCYSVDPTHIYHDAKTISFVEINTTIEHWRTNQVSFIGHHDHHTITIDDQNEGEVFERAVWASLESVFPFTLHKGAQVKIGNKTRELTDVLAFYEYGNFLIEAKDLSVLQAGYERDQERRTKGVQKQIKKAISQLVGACNAISRGNQVFDFKGETLNVVKNQPPHCLILITELMHWGDWEEIEDQLVQAMLSTGAFFHLLDLRELITLLKGSSGKPYLLDLNLMERCKLFVQNRSVHIRSQANTHVSH